MHEMRGRREKEEIGIDSKKILIDWSICRGCVKKKPRHLDGSRSCQEFIGQTESFSMDREAVEKLFRRNFEISMDWKCDKVYRGRRKKGSIDANLSRICQEVVELEERRFFKKGKTHRDEYNKQAIQI